MGASMNHHLCDCVESGENHSWECVEKGQIPERPVYGGFDTSANDQYVAKGNFQGDWIPGKYVPNHGICYIAWNGSEKTVSVFKVLNLNSGYKADWREEEDEWNLDDGLPIDAFSVGETSGDTLYVGRKYIGDGGCHIGTISLAQQTCFIPYDGRVHAYKTCQVLRKPTMENSESHD